MIRKTLLAAAIALPCAAAAQTAPAGWQTNCQNDACTLVLGVAEAGTGRSVATFIVVLSKSQDTARVGVALPLGTALDAGVRMIAGEKTIDVPFQVCFPDGCRATAEADGSVLSSLTGAEAVEVQFFPYASDKPVAIEVPMTGLGEAIAAAKAKLASP